MKLRHRICKTIIIMGYSISGEQYIESLRFSPNLSVLLYVAMPKLSIEARYRVIALHSRGYCVQDISRRLREENIVVSQRVLYYLLKKYRDRNIVKDLPRRKKAPKITEEIKIAIEESLQNDDEITSRGIKNLIAARWPDVAVSISTIKRVRRLMGWVCTRPHYCQLLRDVSS